MDASRTSESHKRSITKAISWRILGTADTLLLSYIFTGSLVIAGSIASAESVTKIVLYYLHERAWAARQDKAQSISAEAASERSLPVLERITP